MVTAAVEAIGGRTRNFGWSPVNRIRFVGAIAHATFHYPSLLQHSQPQMEGVLANMDTTSVLLQNFVRQVSARPWTAFTGVKPPPGLEPPPPGPPVDSPASADGNPPPREHD
jgi:hypothetical protein